MRPKAIKTFELLFGLSIILSVIQSFLFWRAGEMSTSEIGVGAVVVLVLAALIRATSRGASNLARWLLTISAMLSLAVTGYALGRGVRPGFGISDAADLAGVLLQAAAVAMLWTPSGRSWFAARDVAAA